MTVHADPAVLVARQASSEELTDLHGIGLRRAQLILQMRSVHYRNCQRDAFVGAHNCSAIFPNMCSNVDAVETTSPEVYSVFTT